MPKHHDEDPNMRYALAHQSYHELRQFLMTAPLPISWAAGQQLLEFLREAQPVEDDSQKKLGDLRQQLSVTSTALEQAQGRLQDFSRAFADAKVKLPAEGYRDSEVPNAYAEGDGRPSEEVSE